MAGGVFNKRLRYYLTQDALFWLRPLLVIVQLPFIAALAFSASQRQLMLVNFLFLGVGLTLISLRWPPLGLIVASLAGLVVSYTGPSGLNVTIILLALMLGLWLLSIIVRQPQARFVTSRAVWPLLAFLVIAFLSFGYGQLPWQPFAIHAPLGAQFGGLLLVVLSAGAFLLVANQVQDLSWLRRMTWAFLAVAALLVFARSILTEFGLPTRGLFQQVGSVFFIWLAAIAFSQAALNRDLNPRWRLALAGLVLVTFYVLLVQKFADKSGWLPSLISVAAIVGLRYRRAGVVIVLAAAVSAPYLMSALLSSDTYSVSTRFDAMVIVWQLIKVSPIWGMGFANYYWYTPLIPIRGYAVNFNSHNNYLDILAQTGVIGLVCFLWFFWEAGRLAWRLRDRVPDGFASAYVYGALGGLVGTVVVGMFGDWVLPFFYNIGLSGFKSSMFAWLFLGGLVSLEQMGMSSRSRE